jgi:hypothetical protein
MFRDAGFALASCAGFMKWNMGAKMEVAKNFHNVKLANLYVCHQPRDAAVYVLNLSPPPLRSYISYQLSHRLGVSIDDLQLNVRQRGNTLMVREKMLMSITKLL